MPVKNGEKYIKEALENIKKQQMNVEIIVVNDGSTDNTAKIAKEYGCIVINKDVSEGPVKAKNDGLKIAKGDYIMFHDHDDVMRANALKTLYSEFDESCFAVEAKVKDFISPDIPEDEAKKTIIKSEAYFGLFTGAILIKKEVFDIIGNFNETVTAGEIIDWQSKMEKNNLKIKKFDFVSTLRRIHSTNFGKTQKKTEFKDYAALLRAKMLSNNKKGVL
jgi:glycosyltransferase involved in cell wall biosynthesis